MIILTCVLMSKHFQDLDLLVNLVFNHFLLFLLWRKFQDPRLDRPHPLSNTLLLFLLFVVVIVYRTGTVIHL